MTTFRVYPPPIQPNSVMPAVMSENKAANGPGWFTRAFDSAQHVYQRKRLILKLSRILGIARDHQENGLPSGSPEYQLLLDKANRLIDEYVAQFSLDRKQIECELPALGSLERLTHAITVTRNGGVGAAAVLAAILALPVVWALGCGIYTLVYHLIVHRLGGL